MKPRITVASKRGRSHESHKAQDGNDRSSLRRRGDVAGRVRRDALSAADATRDQSCRDRGGSVGGKPAVSPGGQTIQTGWGVRDANEQLGRRSGVVLLQLNAQLPRLTVQVRALQAQRPCRGTHAPVAALENGQDVMAFECATRIPKRRYRNVTESSLNNESRQLSIEHGLHSALTIPHLRLDMTLK